MSRVAGSGLAWSVVLIAAFSVSGNAQQANSGAPVFRTETRMVVVDVVATDANGNPVHGLNAGQFHVLEDGKEQRIQSFEEHRADQTRPAAVEKPPVLAPGVYSNWTPTPSGSAVNIVLFDALNMNFEHQAYARMQLIKCLKSLPRGEKVALFILGRRLRMVQNFTGDSDALIATANRLGGLVNLEAVSPQVDLIAEDNTLTVPRTGDLQYLSPSVHTPETILQDFLSEDVRAIGDLRLRITLQALRDLARFLGSIPGRKNLIWVSGDFPAFIGSYTEASSFRSFDRELRSTAALLAARQIAVYPIDARGLTTPNVDAQTPGNGITGFSKGGTHYYSQILQNTSRALQGSHDAMDELARQTGGRAFYNTNGISESIGKSIESGSTYYTISYSPANKRWDGRLRSIEVKGPRNGVKLTYRRGYYAVADPFAPMLKIKTTDVDVQKRLIEAVQPTSPEAPGILLRASVSGQEANKPIRIDYSIDARDLTLAPSADGGSSVHYELVAVAWDEDDNNSAQAWEMADRNMNSAELSEILRGGIKSHRFLTLKPGNYHVYLGVIDVESKKIGTLVIPLRIPKEVAALK